MVTCNWNSKFSSIRKCSEKGKENIKGWKREYLVITFVCVEHKKEYIDLLDRNDWKYKWLKPSHVCSLILCKECMKNVREHLSY